jgi:hypothetical protein
MFDVYITMKHSVNCHDRLTYVSLLYPLDETKEPEVNTISRP